MTREQVAEIVVAAKALIAAHERRNPTSLHETLGEHEALFNLSLALNSAREKAA